MGVMTLFFALASLGLPGLANFIGEFLVLAGTFKVYPWFAGVAAFGFVLSVIYSLYLVYRVLLGPLRQPRETTDLRFGEMLNLSVLAVGLIWIGLFPQTVLNTSKVALEKSKAPKTTTTQSDTVVVYRHTNTSTLRIKAPQEIIHPTEKE
jgi:NADH-quinone oxidoreductase subunit M